ncbi:hypothetical protein GCM10020229_76710 [Kitasatospora albolonga]|uniref:hypothetical protein n=1 Tax=Kitasatospora albolonga TaxID=68173 RepID=UPI0031ECE499
MQTKLDAAKAELLTKAAAAAENSQVGGAAPGEGLSNGALASYLRYYYLHTAPEDLVDRDPVDVYGAAASHYRLGLKRPQGTAEVRVYTPTVEENGWSCGHTVVEGRHRRHALPGRLGHQRADPPGPRHPRGDPPPAGGAP